MTIELFFSPICPHCPRAREILLEVLEEVNHKIRLEEVNVFSTEGVEKAEKYGVMAVPTIIVNRKRKIVGVPSKEGLLRVIRQEIVKERTESG